MTTQHYDLVIRGGEVYDGTGAASYGADVGIRDGKIAAIGPDLADGAEEIDATGKVVSPGFVDIHTHYDGQAVWDDQLAPSSWHGVTTAVMGNCGVGFAPCREEDRHDLIALMEGVEDIPSPVLSAGLSWEWESFPEYLDVLEQTTRDSDLCALVPHAPLRVYVMGKRALRLEPATATDVDAMRSLVSKAIEAGAFGVSTSRSTAHQTLKGDFTPTLLAREREITSLMMGIKDAGRGLLEVVTETTRADPDVLGEYEMLRRGIERSGIRVVYSLAQSGDEVVHWRDLMRFSDQATADGLYLRPVVAPRAIGLIMGLEASQHPLAGTAAYHEIRGLPLAERVARMRDTGFRARMLTEDPLEFNTWPLLQRIAPTSMYRLGNPPCYEPGAEDSIASIAAQGGRDPKEVIYDILLKDDGMGFIYVPFTNYGSGNLDACEEMLANPNTIMGLGDGGAHVGYIVDASFPVFLLTHWVRERRAMTLAEGIRRLTSDTADAMELTDRGRIHLGLRADINVIDFDNLALESPYVSYDLPVGGKRMLQRPVGIDATIVAGTVTYRHGVSTGARPGRLVRSRPA